MIIYRIKYTMTLCHIDIKMNWGMDVKMEIRIDGRMDVKMYRKIYIKKIWK